MSGTIILQCGCGGTTPTPAQAFQSRRYGAGKRVFNMTAKAEASCTCCGGRKRLSENDVDRKKVKKGTGGSGGARMYTALPPADGWTGGPPEKNGFHVI